MEEEDDFGVMTYGQNKSNLQNLFNDDPSEEHSNQSLMYSAPKQPKKNSPDPYKNMKLLHSIAVHSYKLKSKEYQYVGKMGAAVLGDHDSFVYIMYLYKKKALRQSCSTISSNFCFIGRVDNYAEFTDDSKIVWSLKFENEKDLIEFGKQIALAKVNSTGSNPNNLSIQELIPGSGSPATNGDFLDIVYKGWLYEAKSFGKVIDDNTESDKVFSICLGKSKIMKGWYEGLIGARQGAVRLIIMPPDFGYGELGLENIIPPNAVLIFEIKVQKISPPNTTDEPISVKKPEVPRKSSTTGASHDNIRSRGASLSEQLTLSPRKDSKLISRVAKVGLSMLPIAPANAQTSSDSDAEREDLHRIRQREHSGNQRSSSILQREVERESETKTSRKETTPESSKYSQLESNAQKSSPVFQEYVQGSPRHRLAEGNIQKTIQNDIRPVNETESNVPLVYPLSPQFQNHAMYPMNVVSAPYHGPYPFQYHGPPLVNPMTPIIDNSHLVNFTEESRFNSEQIKSILSHCVVTREQVEKMNKTLEDITSQSNMTLYGKVRNLDAAVLAQNIDQIISENLQLKQDNESKATKLQLLSDKMYEVLLQNQQSSMKASTALELQNEAVNAKLIELKQKNALAEDEKCALKAKLNDALANYCKKQNEYEELMTEKHSVSEKVNVFQEKLNIQEKLLALRHEKEGQDKNEELQLHHKEMELFREEKENDFRELQKAKAQVLELTKKLEDAIEYEEKFKTATQWKTKCTDLRRNLIAMKEEYEKKINVLTTELKKSREISKVPQEYSLEIKKAMNIVYKSLQNQVKGKAVVTGDEYLEITLGIIRSVTMCMIENKEKDVNKENGNIVSKTDDVSPNIGEGSHIAPVVPSSGAKDDKNWTDERADAPDLADEQTDALNLTDEQTDAHNSADNQMESNEELQTEVLPLNNEARSVSEDKNVEIPQDTVNQEHVKIENIWKAEPPPLFEDEDEEDDDDWLK